MPKSVGRHPEQREGALGSEERGSSKGQVTLPKEVRERLKVESGGHARDLKGLLKRPNQKRLSLEEMDAAIGRAHARNCT